MTLEKCFEIGKMFGDEIYCLNVNFPEDPNNIKGFKITRVGFFIDDINMIEYGEGFRPAKYNLDYDLNNKEIDYTAHREGYVSITPITPDKTHNGHYKLLKESLK